MDFALGHVEDIEINHKYLDISQFHVNQDEKARKSPTSKHYY